ncbi:MAG: hypothetical protein RIQ53_4011 [Pseudomonadota bacterium]|jgi:integrase
MPTKKAARDGLLPLMEARPWKDGKTITYRYHPIGGKPINLGTDKLAAVRQVLDLLGKRDSHGTLTWVWEHYTRDADSAGRPIRNSRWARLAEGTRADYRGAWRQIEPILGHMLMAEITPSIVARYVHIERAESPRRADIEKALLSRLFGHGIKLGVCEHNGTDGVEPHGSEARTEAPSPAVLERFLRWLSQQTPQRQVIGMAAEFAALAGSRRTEFLRLTLMQVDRDAGVIRMPRAKQRGGKAGAIFDEVAMSPRLTALIDRMLELRDTRGRTTTYLLPSSRGTAYSARGFATLWQRCWTDALKAGVIKAADRFTFHDLRAYYATQHKAATGALPDLHKNPDTTARVYDRNKVVPRRSL